MLGKREILQIGTIVKVRYENDSKDTYAVIVGHLTLTEQMQCHYDYICVEFPYGIERGVFYINHTDILETLYHCADHEKLHENWMERKYGEYLAYYKQYRPDLRPDMNEIKKRKVLAEETLGHFATKQKAITLTATIITAIGIGITAFLTKQWIAVPGALLFSVMGFVMGRFID